MAGLEKIVEAHEARETIVVRRLFAQEFVAACAGGLAMRDAATDDILRSGIVSIESGGRFYHPRTRDRFDELYAERRGYTLLNVDRVSEEASGLKTFTSHNFPGEVVVHQYVSETGNAVLKQHYDGHDVLWLQLEGRKRAGLGDEGIPVIVEPGDMLFIPQGVLHTTEAIEDSSHLCIGLLEET